MIHEHKIICELLKHHHTEFIITNELTQFAFLMLSSRNFGRVCLTVSYLEQFSEVIIAFDVNREDLMDVSCLYSWWQPGSKLESIAEINRNNINQRVD